MLNLSRSIKRKTSYLTFRICFSIEMIVWLTHYTQSYTLYSISNRGPNENFFFWWWFVNKQIFNRKTHPESSKMEISVPLSSWTRQECTLMHHNSAVQQFIYMKKRFQQWTMKFWVQWNICKFFATFLIKIHIIRWFWIIFMVTGDIVKLFFGMYIIH